MIDEADFVASLQVLFREELDQANLVIDMDTSKDNLDLWDSLAHVRLVIGIERMLGIQFDVSEIESIDSVRGFYEAAKNHLR